MTHAEIGGERLEVGEWLCAAEVACTDDGLDLYGNKQLLQLVGNGSNAVRDVQVANDEHQHRARSSTPASNACYRLLSAFFPTHTIAQ